MMITIYGLAPKTKYQDVKLLIKQQCNIEEFILDNLVVDTDGSKKVRIGLADDSEGYKLMKCLNGYRMPGNFILKLLPVGKTPTNPNVATQGTYDSRPGYQNQPQNDYTIQQRTDYMGSNDFNPSPRGASGLTVQIRCPRPYAPSIQPQGSMDSMRPWTPGGHSNQWGANQPSVALQVPQNTYYGPGTNHASPGFTHQQPGPRPEIQHFEQNRQVLRPEQGYTGYSPKNNIPITIMKENFQGPSQYNINSPAGQYLQHTPPSSWQQQGHQVTQPKPQFSKSGVYDKPYDDRKYQSDQPRDPKAVQPKPDTYKEYEKRRGFSPPERREEPVVRRVSPARRDERAPAKVQPPLRRVSPQRNDRRYSPTGKKSSPAADRHHHNVRHETSHKGPSPTRRLASPVRRDDRPVPRYSPPRHHDKTADKYAPDKDVKKVRPAYDPPAQASNQAMYSGGYRPSHHDNVTLTASAKRQEHPTQHPKQHPPSWQRHRDEPPVPKQDVERRDSRLQIARERLTEHTEKPFSPARKSRSPHRQNRSPNRDRYKKNSPSPRSSYSPRRSWALEKRRSPDAPPPPVWPGQNEDRNRSARPSIPEKDDKPKHQPVWEPRSFKEEEQRHRRPDERQFEEAKMRIAKDLMERPPQQAADTNRFQREPKFSPRRDECDRDNYRRRETPDRKVRREDFDISRRARDEDRPDNYDRRRLQSPRHESRGNSVKEVDKDFGDVYNRAVPFRKKVDELRKSPSKKREDFDDDRRHDERDRNREEIRHRYEEHMRYREEESRRLRERDERPEDRTDRLREDRVHRDEDRRDDYRTREDMERERDRAKIIDDNKPKRIFYSNTVIKQKRDKAIEEISEKIMNRNEDYKHVQGEQRQRIFEELKLSVARIVYDMFGETDVSFIEIIVKYQARYTLKDEEQILQNVMLSLPKQFRTIKRHASDVSDIPAKTSRLDPNAELNTGAAARPTLSESTFNVNLAPPNVISVPYVGVPQTSTLMNPIMVPVMVPSPFYQSFDFQQNPVPAQQQSNVQDTQQPHPTNETQEVHSLYLCKDDSERITNMEADLLKEFLISEMFKASGNFNGWAPDLTFKGLQTLTRYELETRDENSKDWLLKLDFIGFKCFNVLVYTKEELWFERAAIWLPGHSSMRHIEPLDKLKLQNKKLEGVNIDKWKFVKKIVNEKGTRLYVDMPPSSARALEAIDKKLSYELQQVNVYLKAIAVDKTSFDAGMKEKSFPTEVEIHNSIKFSPMPSLTNDQSLVKIVLKGSKNLCLNQVRKIKEFVIYNIFKYHQQDGLSRTDFVKYGYLPPNYFAILPLNQESRRWLLGRSFGKMDRQVVVVIGGEEDDVRFIKMFATMPHDGKLREAHVLERLKRSNQGVKGIYFNRWQSIKLKAIDNKRSKYVVNIDLDSLETMSTMSYQLDYVDPNGLRSLYFRSDYSQSGLDELIKKQRAEMTDSYDVANMDLDSDQSDGESSDVICLD